MAKNQTKEKILSAAAKLFGRYGFRKTTMDEIADTANKAKGSVYYYFSSKEDLYLEVVTREILFLKTGLNSVVSNGRDVAEMIKSYLVSRMKLMKNAVNYHESLRPDMALDFEFLREVQHEFTEFEIGLMEQLLQRGMQDDRLSINDPRATAQVIIHAIKAIEIPFYRDQRITEYEHTIVELLDILIKGLERR